MTILSRTSLIPDPSSIFMPPTSRADAESPAPTPSAVPLPDRSENRPEPGPQKETESQAAAADEPHQDSEAFPQPKLRLEVRDIGHPGAQKFLGAVNASDVLTRAVANIQRLLYRTVADPATHMPPTRSVTVFLRVMDGVAYTTGSELDNDHKEIHFSLDYISQINEARLAHEIGGVLTHELAHCYQWNGHGTCPGGLIEGIADWVRLNCDLSPPHWRRDPGDQWDAGYQHTAYFLQYLEGRFGTGTVRKMNETLRQNSYEAKPFWTQLLGGPVEQLWGDYLEHVKKGKKA